MTSRTGAAAVVRGLRLVRLAGLLGLTACTARPKATESRGPFLSIVEAQGDAGVRPRVAAGAVALALGGLPPGELGRVREHMKESSEGALRRAAPEVFDLEGKPDGDAGPDALRQALRDLPALIAAANLLGSPWNAAGLSVHLGPVCEAAASRCVPVFCQGADAGDALVRRGRSLAWALGNAALLRVPAEAREGRLRALREAQLRPSSTLAIVFDTPRGTLDAAELELLHGEARRELGQLAEDAPQRPWLDAFEAAPTTWELPVTLDADEILVIPRLSAMARLHDFASEVESAGPFEWIRRP